MTFIIVYLYIFIRPKANRYLNFTPFFSNFVFYWKKSLLWSQFMIEIEITTLSSNYSFKFAWQKVTLVRDVKNERSRRFCLNYCENFLFSLWSDKILNYIKRIKIWISWSGPGISKIYTRFWRQRQRKLFKNY